ncbi:hypothetical protein [Candidatus Vidania fulgoroideorum]
MKFKKRNHNIYKIKKSIDDFILENFKTLKFDWLIKQTNIINEEKLNLDKQKSINILYSYFIDFCLSYK